MRLFRNIIVLVFIFSPTIISAQSGKLKRLENLYAKEKFDKCLKKSLKYKSKHPKDENIYFLLTKLYFHEFEQESSLNSKNANLKKVLQNYKKFFKYTDDTVLLDINKDIKSFADSLYSSRYKSKSKSYYKFLAQYYQDTSVNYFDFYKLEETNDSEEIVFEEISNVRDQFLVFVEDLVGIPYKYGGESPSGFDCSGFVKYSYNLIGIELPHNAHLQSGFGETISIDDAKPGDMIFFGNRNGKKYHVVHAGIIYSINGDDLEIVHCVSRGVQIDDKASNNWQYYWKDRILFVKRLIED